jgi:hypothetical protein
MDEQKTTGAEEASAHAGAPAGGCFFCAVLPMLERRWDEATGGHFRAARVEFLKGMRSLIDSRIASLSTEERKGSHVTVE